MPEKTHQLSFTARMILLPVVTLLAACSIGPKYARPSLAVPPAYKELGTAGAQTWQPAQPRDDGARGNWWEVFNEPRLNELEQKLNVSNQNIAAEAAGVLAARAMIRQARAQYFPVVTANPSITNSRIATGFGRPLGIGFTSYSFPFDAAWELDLWGRVRKTVAINTFAAQASVADLANVRLSAQAELAADYFELRGQDSLKKVLDTTVKANQEALELTNDLCDSGLDSDEAVAQAEAQLRGTEAQRTNLGLLRAQYEHAIALLIGQPASSFSIPAESSNLTPPPIPAGIPSELLERRPDISAAERAVAAANMQIGVARTAFFPAITLGGSGGFQGLSAADWLQWPSRVWSVGPSLAATVFDAGMRRATVQQFQAGYQQAVANYRETVLTAFQEVEDNLAAIRILTQVIDQQETAVLSATRSLQEAEVRYDAGLDPYLDVVAARTAVMADQQAAVGSRTQRMVASVQLIKALGGGWDASQLPSASELQMRLSDRESYHGAGIAAQSAPSSSPTRHQTDIN